jgi:diguanylate cyclase (GGDEF)-like protein/PAS domain S-box-containing protein
MPAENFYITLYDEVKNVLHFPYFRDALDEPFLGEIEPGKGLTAHVLRTGKSLLCTQAVHDELERQGAVKLLGVPSAIWLGVPLIIEGKTIGAMVVQHYSDPEAYGERELHMLEFVSSQVAVAIKRKQAEDALRESEERFRRIFEEGPLGMAIVGSDYRLVKVNNRLCQMLGYTQQELTALTLFDITHPEDIELDLRQAEKVFRGEIPNYAVEKRYLKRDQEVLWVNSTSSVIQVEGKSLDGLVMMEDITARKQAEEKLRQLSTHDILTGLFNRGYFEAEMTRLEGGRQFPVSIVMADVDQLKETNDSQGHAAGDTLLKRLAQVLSAAFRAEDILARIGGDEFAVLLPNTGSSAVKKALIRLRRILREHNAAHTGPHLQVSFGASTAQKYAPLADVLKEADENMYIEKRSNLHPELVETPQKSRRINDAVVKSP